MYQWLINTIYLFGRGSWGYLYECHRELSFRYAQCGTLAAQTQSAMQTHWLQSLLPSPVCWPICWQIPRSNKCLCPTMPHSHFKRKVWNHLFSNLPVRKLKSQRQIIICPPIFPFHSWTQSAKIEHLSLFLTLRAPATTKIVLCKLPKSTRCCVIW